MPAGGFGKAVRRQVVVQFDVVVSQRSWAANSLSRAGPGTEGEAPAQQEQLEISPGLCVSVVKLFRIESEGIDL